MQGSIASPIFIYPHEQVKITADFGFGVKVFTALCILPVGGDPESFTMQNWKKTEPQFFSRSIFTYPDQ
jgi:hypothetical protein